MGASALHGKAVEALALVAGHVNEELLLRSEYLTAEKRRWVFRRISLTTFSADTPAPFAMGSLLAW